MSEFVVHLKPWQDKFVFSEARFPAFVGAWGTGKDLSTIARAMMLSYKYPKNLGLIARAEATDLADSTIKDFEQYTGIKLDSHRNAKLKNGSEIMFRHLEELSANNLNNMNLGFFGLIQADELKTDEVFSKLQGRLRRCHGCGRPKNPITGKTECVCYHSGFLSANANAEDWICKLFGSPELGIKGILENAELVEAKTFDNADILPKAYIESLDNVKKARPEMYDRFVLNSRKVGSDKFVVIPLDALNFCIDRALVGAPLQEQKRRLTVCDPAEGDTNLDDDTGEGGGDETVIYDFEESKIVGSEIYNDYKLMDTVGRIQAHATKNKSTLICVDKIGIGAGVVARLEEIYRDDPQMVIYGFDSRITPPKEGEDNYANYKTYAWFKARDKYFVPLCCSIPNDPILKKQLSRIRYRYTSGGRGGKYILESKKKMKQILQCSPDRADAVIMGLDALDRTPYSMQQNINLGGAWVNPRFSPRGAMA